MAYLQAHTGPDQRAPSQRSGPWEDLPIEPIFLVVLLGWMIAFGGAAASAALGLGRPAPIWFMFGAILGPLALVVLRRAPPDRCRACGSPTRGWLNECWWCGQDVSPSRSRSSPANAGRAASEIAVRPDRDLARAAEPPRLREAAPAAVVRTTRQALPPQKNEPAAHEGSAMTTRAPATALEHPVRMLAERRERTKSLDSQSQVPAPVDPAYPTAGWGATPARFLATAVYVTGNSDLQPGHRYGIAIRQSQLQILGPTDSNPDTVVFNTLVAGVDAQSLGGRLVLSSPQGLALAFMAVSGPTTAELAATIVTEARGSAR